MSVEDRIRAGLAREADLVEPAVEREYATVLRRHGRRRRTRAAGWLAAAAAVAAVAVAVASGLQPADDARPAPVSDPGTLVGEYVVDVAPSPESREVRMQGRWMIVLDRGGSMDLVPPQGYEGVVSGAVYEVEGRLLRTNAFLQQPGCQAGADRGAYQWHSDDDTLWFAPAREDCPARRLLFSAQPWERVR